MAVIIEMAYGKKLGLPEYSSHNFNVSLKVEVASLEDIHAEVERVYRILQTSVDEQIVNPGFVPGHERPAASNAPRSDAWQCSDQQKELILKIVDENQLDRNDVDQLARDRFGRGVTQLNKLEASGLIEELFQRAGNARPGGSRNRPPQRRAA